MNTFLFKTHSSPHISGRTFDKGRPKTSAARLARGTLNERRPVTTWEIIPTVTPKASANSRCPNDLIAAISSIASNNTHRIYKMQADNYAPHIDHSYNAVMKKELWNTKAKRRLKDLGFNYGDVAQVLGITPGAVSHKLNGTRPTFVDELQGIARMCKLSLSELCEDDPRFLIEKTDKDIFDIVKNMTEEEKETALRLLGAIKGG